MTKRQQNGLAKEEIERDTWFNSYRFPASERAWKVVRAVIVDFEASENRKRARSTEDQHWLRDAATALISDLTYQYLLGNFPNGVIVPRAKRVLGKTSRYYRPLFTRTFPKLLNALNALEYLKQRKGTYSGFPGKSKSTTIRAGAKLIALIEKYEIGFDDLALDDGEEVIVLKRAKYGHWDKGERIEYENTPKTNRLREEVRAINSWLKSADITFDPAAYPWPVDPRARRLFRYFANANFESGGRLFKGFWQNLPKKVRLSGITIEGERVVELDYSQLNPTLAYSAVGCSPPYGDAYSLAGFEPYRDGVKRVFNALLFDTKPRKSFPRDIKSLFPPKTKIGDVISGIRQKHPMLKSVLSTGRGFHLMFIESEIMMRVLDRLRAQNIIGLPMFDAVIVKASAVEAARTTMITQSKQTTGIVIQVRVEGLEDFP